MKVFHCDHCGQLLFFENVSCVRCGRALAFVPELRRLVSLDGSNTFKLCANYTNHDVCNWGLSADDPEALCRACRLTRTIPNLTVSGNIARWYKLETAKRRLVYTLDQLGLPLTNKAEDPHAGLAFEFLEDAGAPVMTGHASGVITLNIAEADDAERVRRRVELNEPYRTLLGHFRHESGHYYWDRLVAPTDRLGAFRELFGDERADYQAGVRRHYAQGAPPGWQDAHVSAYATMHPWEDWAETWAHYLHVVDTLETAAACGVSTNTLAKVPNPMSGHEVPFDRMMDSWVAITYVLNMLNRGLGNADAYPFVLSPSAIEKLRFVHDTITLQ